eukprot:TRINITY_DN9533_c0_g1_i9.p1 TRINITY_DN9533_c0_g1~~TRINITY_DN9533_c0_g1_i9.p1  ORF type:complete len:245 (+),score=7.03 TRINITY_DN9533_c0_g1_i9:269-1003(+)
MLLSRTLTAFPVTSLLLSVEVLEEVLPQHVVLLSQVVVLIVLPLKLILQSRQRLKPVLQSLQLRITNCVQAMSGIIVKLRIFLDRIITLIYDFGGRVFLVIGLAGIFLIRLLRFFALRAFAIRTHVVALGIPSVYVLQLRHQFENLLPVTLLLSHRTPVQHYHAQLLQRFLFTLSSYITSGSNCLTSEILLLDNSSVCNFGYIARLSNPLVIAFSFNCSYKDLIIHTSVTEGITGRFSREVRPK